MSAEWLIDTSDQSLITRLRGEQSVVSDAATPPPEWWQWLQYWDDEESLAGNLRNLEHWLMRA